MTIDERLEKIERLIILQTKNVYNVRELSWVLGITEDRVRHLMQESEFPYYKVGNRTYFKKEEIEAWMTRKRFESRDEIEARAATYCTINPLKR